MGCPTCSHTLSQLYYECARTWFHCSRCGTLVVRYDGTDHRDVYVPALVTRCRELVADRAAAGHASAVAELHRRGITEACLTPAERPPV